MLLRGRLISYVLNFGRIWLFFTHCYTMSSMRNPMHTQGSPPSLNLINGISRLQIAGSVITSYDKSRRAPSPNTLSILQNRNLHQRKVKPPPQLCLGSSPLAPRLVHMHMWGGWQQSNWLRVSRKQKKTKKVSSVLCQPKSKFRVEQYPIYTVTF